MNVDYAGAPAAAIRLEPAGDPAMEPTAFINDATWLTRQRSRSRRNP
jgi:hypothetical protein